jgi:hypothetical protein
MSLEYDDVLLKVMRLFFIYLNEEIITWHIKEYIISEEKYLSINKRICESNGLLQ